MAKIAFLAPLSGPESVVGIPMMHAVALAIDEAREAGQVPFPVELLALDDQANPHKARELAQALIEDDEVIGVVGHKNSGPSRAAGAVYAAGGLAQITPSSTNSDLARQGWQTFFRVCATNDDQARAAARYALDVLQVQRVAVVHDNTDYGRPLAETFISTIREGGGQIVRVEAIRLGQRTFGDTVNRLKAVECDLIYFGLTEIESAFLARALRAAEVRAQLFGADGGRGSLFPRLAGEAAEGVYETYAGVDAWSMPEAQEFLQAYQSRHGKCPVFGPETYDAACILLEAVRRAGVPDRGAVLAELKSLDDFAGVTGSVLFGPDGNRQNAQVTIWQVVRGEMTLLR